MGRFYGLLALLLGTFLAQAAIGQSSLQQAPTGLEAQTLRVNPSGAQVSCTFKIDQARTILNQSSITRQDLGSAYSTLRIFCQTPPQLTEQPPSALHYLHQNQSPQCNGAVDKFEDTFADFWFDQLSNICKVVPGASPVQDLLDCGEEIQSDMHEGMTPGFALFWTFLKWDVVHHPEKYPNINSDFQVVASAAHEADVACFCLNGVKDFIEHCDPSDSASSKPCTNQCEEPSLSKFKNLDSLKMQKDSLFPVSP